MAWVSVFDDTKWESSDTADPSRTPVWTGSQWSVPGYNPYDLIPKGTWFAGYPATEVRVTAVFTGGTPSFVIGYTFLLGAAATYNVVSGSTYSLTATIDLSSKTVGDEATIPIDFTYAEFDSITLITLTNIEFNVVSTALWQSFIGTIEV